jgi:hypothetical protein
MMVLDFVGNAGNHKLITPMDVLAGNYDEDVIAKAKEDAEEREPGDLVDALEKARRELAALQELARQRIEAKVNSTVRPFNPFECLHMATPQSYDRFGGQPATAGQRGALRKMLPKGYDVEGLTKPEASRLMTSIIKRSQKNLANPKQLAVLQRYGATDINVGFEAASAGIDYIQSCGWKNVDVGVLRGRLLGKTDWRDALDW